jgi:glutathione S-transferase
MTSPDLVLFHSHRACSQVTICALEIAELPYKIEVIDLRAGEQRLQEHLQRSPLGKVPVLMIDGSPLLENVGILSYIAALRPEKDVLPANTQPLARAEAISGLSFCSSTLHPQIRGIANPGRLTTGDVDGVRAQSLDLAAKSFGYAEERLAHRKWWLGQFSIVDVYLNWAFNVACRAGFDGARLPTLSGMEARLMEFEAFRRMRDIEEQAGKPEVPSKAVLLRTPLQVR